MYPFADILAVKLSDFTEKISLVWFTNPSAVDNKFVSFPAKAQSKDFFEPRMDSTGSPQVDTNSFDYAQDK
jgi:hypothetical protein